MRDAASRSASGRYAAYTSSVVETCSSPSRPDTTWIGSSVVVSAEPRLGSCADEVLSRITIPTVP